VVKRWRLGLFFAVSAALLAAALGFSRSPELVVRPRAPTGYGVGGGPAPAPGAAFILRAAIDRGARAFLAAFFRYEVGELGAGVRAALRATATPRFAAELLSAPPWRPPRSYPAPATSRLSIRAVSVSPPRALVEGSARRGRQTEPFSFLFEARDGAWLASGPGE